MVLEVREVGGFGVVGEVGGDCRFLKVVVRLEPMSLDMMEKARRRELT